MPAPKPPSKRRRRNTPASYGAAEPTTAPAAAAGDRELGIDNPHPLVTSMWDAVQNSCEARFYSEADWVAAADRIVVREPGDAQPAASRPGQTWADGPARAERDADEPGGEASRGDRGAAAGPDTDENAAVSMIGQYQSKLKPVD